MGVGDMRMKQNPDFWMSITMALKALWPTLGASFVSCVVCYARLIHDGENRKNKWIEGILCGLLAFSVSHGLSYIGLPDNADVFAGGVIGFIGVEKIREMVLRVVSKKTGGNCD